jgi:putative peptide zinc metalloprotease protein
MNEPRTLNYTPRPAVAPKLIKGQRGVMSTVWDMRTPPPTFTQPQLAVILVPKAVPGARVGGGGAAASAATDKGWVFPFDKPLVPGPDDNQALAVNTTDNVVDYEAAFALVWETDEDYAMNINDAEAYASCNNCGAVAVAYQVVFVIDKDDTNDNVAAPENLAGALNYNCVNCLTYALAQQLFVTLDEPLSGEAMAALDKVWAEIDAYQDKIEAGQVKLEDIDDQLQAYTNQIKAIVEADQPGTFMTSTAVSTTAAPTSSPTATVSTSATAAIAPSTTSAPPPAPSATGAPSGTTAPSTSTAPTTSAGSTSTVTTSDGSGSTGPTAPSGSTSTGTTSDGTSSGGTTSGGTTSGGTASSP